MRPSRTVAGGALAAALALGALPGLVGSYEQSEARPIEAAAFRQVNLATTRDRQSTGQVLPDAAGRSDGALGTASTFGDPLGAPRPLDERARPDRSGSSRASSWRTPRFTLSGTATFYDNGTTAMRLPSGTHVVICGAGGCIERVVDDYGPTSAGGRVVDLYRPDFFQICGCGSWSGTTEVTVRIY